MDDVIEKLKYRDCLAKNFLFGSIAVILDTVNKAPKEKKLKEIEHFMSWSKDIRAKFLTVAQPSAENSFFPILRLLVVESDNERGAYGIGDLTFSQLYTRALGILPNSAEAKVLKDKFDPNQSGAGVDLAAAVFSVVERRATTKTSTMTVFEFNRHLDNLAAARRSQDKEDELARLVVRLTPLEQKWAVRIIQKHLLLGISRELILSAYDERANELSKRMAYLSAVCAVIESNQPTPGLLLFMPFRFQLCLRLNFQEIKRDLQAQEYFVESKMDGDRFQIHRKGDQYRFYSKNSNDFTAAFGGDPLSGSLTPRIHSLFAATTQNFILDGEMLVWETEAQRFVPKSEHGDPKCLKPGNAARQPCYCVYDILLHNGRCLIDVPYAERVRLLATLFTETPGTLVIVRRQRITRTDEVLGALNAAIERLEEGIVVKSCLARYLPGERGGGWFKCKPEYLNAVSDLDLLIMGGDYNDKRNRSFIRNWYVGVRERLPDGASRFHCVGPVVMGFTYTERRELNERLERHWKPCPPSPETLIFGKSLPEVWIEPRRSVVLQVKSADLIASENFAVPFILHFARVTHIRYDKEWHDCCELREYEDLCRGNRGQNVIQLTKRTITTADAEASNQPELKRRKVFKPPPKAQISTTADDNLTPIDNVLAEMEFCVIGSGKGLPSKDELKRMIARHGGKVVENPRPSKTHYLVGQDLNLVLRSFINSGTYTILKVSWIVNALGGEEKRDVLPPIRPFDVLCANEQLKKDFNANYDEYSDPYFRSVDREELKEILDKMAPVQLAQQQLFDIEREILGEKNMFNIFRCKTARFLGAKKGSKRILAEMLFKARGGKIAEVGTVPDFVIGDQVEDKENGPVVRPQFVLDSIDSGKILAVKDYITMY